MRRFGFEIVHQSTKSRARVGILHTAHGDITTPAFVPVATNAAIKHVDLQTALRTGVDLGLIFCNTYHLLVHPGPDVVESAGGLHKFMNYPKPIITDSGGFQVFSLTDYETRLGSGEELKGKVKKPYEGLVMKVSEEGVQFKSYRNGDLLLLSPETSIETQKKLGADIIIPLDELPANNISTSQLEEAFHRTHRWEKRSLQAHLKDPRHQAIYSVVHGGTNKELRQESIRILGAEPFDGHAIGGSLGKDKTEMLDLLTHITPMLHNLPTKPVHLLGIGDLDSILSCVPLGIDTFDSCYPTRAGRHGTLFSSKGIVRVDTAPHKFGKGPIDETCQCYTCKTYSTSYLYHLYRSSEPIAPFLGTIHNLYQMFELFANTRKKILQNEI